MRSRRGDRRTVARGKLRLGGETETPRRVKKGAWGRQKETSFGNKNTYTLADGYKANRPNHERENR